MESIKVKIKGLTPHMQHNNRMADPLDMYKKAITPLTSKSKKTDADHEQISRIEWEAGLYFDEDTGYIAVPAENFETMLWTAGKKNKNGPKIKEGVWIEENYVRLRDFGSDHFKLKAFPKGPEDIPCRQLDKLFEKHKDRRLASVPGSKGTIVRSRPRFDKWSYQFTIDYDEDLIDRQIIIETLEVAGKRIGFSDYRPRYGKFDFEIINDD